MFNPELSKKFIKEFYNNPKTRKVVSYLFERVRIREEDFNKNLFNFSYEELTDVLKYLDCAETNALAEKFTHMNNYYKWAENSHACSINLAFSIINRKDFKKYLNIDKLRKQYIRDREELHFLCKDIENVQDKLLLVLPYEGLGGEEMSEIRYLKKEDCGYDSNNVYIIHVLGENERIIPIYDMRSISILEDAKENVPYLNSNGMSEARAPQRYTIDTKYMVRPTKGKGNTNNVLDISEIVIPRCSIQTKMVKIKDWTNKYELSISSIQDSGMFNQLFEMEKTKSLEIEDFRKVMKFYGKKVESYHFLRENYEDYKWALEQE